MIKIIEYNSNLQDKIEAFYKKSFTDLGWVYDPDNRHTDTRNIEQVYMDGGCFWCLMDDDNLIGTVAIRSLKSEDNAAELKRLYVLEYMQGKGYGDMLFKLAVNYAKENNFTKLYADTRNDRFASQHLMHKYGFREAQKYNNNEFAEKFFVLSFTNQNN